MKKILIISFHSLPMDVIASYRAMAYLKHFKKYGIQPTLLTHHWGNEANKSETTVENLGYGTIMRIPIRQWVKSNWLSRIEEIPLINKVSILIRWLCGNLDSKKHDWNSYQSLKAVYFEHLQKNQYDILMGIFSPHHHLRLCYEIHKQFGIPYVLDFRDLWNNRIIHKQYNPNATEWIQDRITRHYWRKWLSRALFFSITSREWMNEIRKFSGTKGVVVHNGYDAEAFQSSNIQQENATIHEFMVLHAGTLYSHQRLDIFLKGCRLFLEQVKPEKFQVKFVGADRKGSPDQFSGYMYEPEKYIETYLDSNFFIITERIPKVELFRMMRQFQLLLFPGFPEAPGTYAGKIFDYLGSGKNILLVPDDKSVVGDLVRETNTGFIANIPEQVNQLLTSLYEEWKEKGTIAYAGNQEVIGKYTRESQVKKMAGAIHNSLKK